jgi:cobalt/nickel transport system permease protein
MHIPDNFLSPAVWASLDAAAIPAIAVVSRQAQKSTDSNRLPLLGVMGAFVFAAQTINFPVGVGTSGHLVGGTLLACLLGPWAAALVVTAILIVQALVFQDGGVLALGANIVNMALMGVLAGYLPARFLSTSKWNPFGVFLGGTCSVLVSGVLALEELVVSGIRIPPAVLGISLGLFAVNALIEGAITVSVLKAIERLNPGVSELALSRQAGIWHKVVPVAAAASALLAAAGVLIASTLPDGVQRLLQKFGMPLNVHPIFHSPLSDYQIQALGTGWFSRAGAGLLGLAFVYALCAVGGYLLIRARRSYS